MPEGPFQPDTFRKSFLILLVIAISLLFVAMIRDFLIALLMAAILSGMFHPLYRRLERAFRGRRALASATTIILVLLLIVIPLIAFLGLVANQALDLSERVRPWVEGQISEPTVLDQLIERVPLLGAIEPYRQGILERLGDLAGRIGSFAVGLVATAARSTAMFVLLLFVMLYAMFFFLIDGRRTLNQILYYLPLPPADEERMLDKFVSVSRATLKGTLIIGLVQGALCGAAFFVLGIEGAAFWSAVMAVLSVVPGVGAAIVWVPAAIYLFAVGRVVPAVGLALWCALIVGSVDNLLRPWLVGRDTQMSDLLILLSTLGGLVLFGAVGIVIGPIVAALFVTVWDLYGIAFKDLLPPAESATPRPSAPPDPPA